MESEIAAREHAALPSWSGGWPGTWADADALAAHRAARDELQELLPARWEQLFDQTQALVGPESELERRGQLQSQVPATVRRFGGPDPVGQPHVMQLRARTRTSSA